MLWPTMALSLVWRVAVLSQSEQCNKVKPTKDRIGYGRKSKAKPCLIFYPQYMRLTFSRLAPLLVTPAFYLNSSLSALQIHTQHDRTFISLYNFIMAAFLICHLREPKLFFPQDY